MSDPLLKATDVTKRFGGIVANDRVSLSVSKGEIVGLIGSNGAGKTTFFNMLCGIPPAGYKPFPDSGHIEFGGVNITHSRPHVICKLGIGRAFQVVQIFNDMTVLSNVGVGAMIRSQSVSEAEDRAHQVLRMVQLDHKAHALGRDLTIAQRKRLEMARALATEPRLLMLDEVMAGLTPREVAEAVEIIRAINATGISILLVEHVLEAVMVVCTRVAVMHQGRKIADSTPQEVVADSAVISAYLGVQDG